MKNAKLSNFYFSAVAIAMCAIFALPLFASKNSAVHADFVKTYQADGYNGEGVQEDASYYVYYDDKQDTLIKHFSVPSFGNGDSALSNTCAPLTAMNIVTFYDRWYDELIPDYTAGVQYPDGRYFYMPDIASKATRNAVTELYNLMNTGDTGGTTSADFKNGLNIYVSNAGRSLSSSSFYVSSATVNLNVLASAVNQNKVGLIMCDTFNFVSSITTNPEQTVDHIAKRNSAAAHMMMVYGYRIIEYYKDNVNFKTDTFLCVCSSYSSGETGYIKLNDYLNIDEALIITIS